MYRHFQNDPLRLICLPFYNARCSNRIIKRMRELGMTPVLPAFAGFVPKNIKKAFPNINVTRASTWNNFPKQFTKDTAVFPLDPEFLEIQQRFLQMQTELLDG